MQFSKKSKNWSHKLLQKYCVFANYTIKPIGSLWVLEKIRTKGYFILKIFKNLKLEVT